MGVPAAALLAALPPALPAQDLKIACTTAVAVALQLAQVVGEPLDRLVSWRVGAAAGLLSERRHLPLRPLLDCGCTACRQAANWCSAARRLAERLSPFPPPAPATPTPQLASWPLVAVLGVAVLNAAGNAVVDNLALLEEAGCAGVWPGCCRACAAAAPLKLGRQCRLLPVLLR